MTKKEKIYCELFKCPIDKTKGNICCCICNQKDTCEEKCLNSLDKCKEAYK